MSFTVYKSSAGSGKTYTLVKEYLQLILCEPENYKRILAITFTNKAAAEMKERIIRELKALAQYPFDKETNTFKFLLPELLENTKLSEKELSKNAEKSLSLILHNYSDFAISTIDSFVHRVIRSFSHDLKIPQNFEVEMDTDRLLSDAVALLINKAGSEEALTKILVEFTESRADEEKNWNIENDLIQFATIITKENTQQHLNQLSNISISDFLNFRSRLNTILNKYRTVINEIALRGNTIFESLHLDDEVFYYGKKGIVNYFRKIIAYPDANPQGNSYVNKTIDENKWTSAKATASDETAINTVKDKLIDCYNEIHNYAEKHFSGFKLYQLIFKNIYPVAVLNEIQKIVEEIKKDEGILPISEFNKKIASIVLNQPVPFIYERIGERYRHYMIDEFQDTSALQWTNLLPLLENSLSTNNFNMIVGDGKQAIYRWRNGDVEQFAALPELNIDSSDLYSKARAESLKRNYEEKFLLMNYRSLPEVILFNNSFFDFVKTSLPESLQKIYDNCAQQFSKSAKGGYVCIDRFDAGRNDEINFSDYNFSRIEEIIHESEANLFKPGDIAILCRSNRNAGRIAKHLLSKEIDVVTDESLLIGENPETGFIIAFFRILLNIKDEPAALEILNYLVQNKKIEHCSLEEILSEYTTAKKINNGLFSLLNKYGYKIKTDFLKSLPLYELAENITEIFNIEKTADPFILCTLDVIKEYTIKHGSSLNSFLEWWEVKGAKRSVNIPDNKKAVRIMTIHKSKGLEFPVVVYPFATESVKKSENLVWIHDGFGELPELPVALISNTKDILETSHADAYYNETDKATLDLVNIVYVAFTRASENLYVITTPAGKSETISVPSLISAFANSIGIKDSESNRIEFGNMQPKQKKEEPAESIGTMKIFDLNTSQNKLHLRQRAAESWTPENPEGNISWGTLAHYVLSRIKTSSDIQKEIDCLVDKKIMTVDDASIMNQKLVAMLENPMISECFSPNVDYKAEAEIILKSGHSARPDRIVFKDKEAIIIDYKTGKKNDHHKSQLNEYAEALTEMGYIVSEKFLLYIDENFVLKV